MKDIANITKINQLSLESELSDILTHSTFLDNNNQLAEGFKDNISDFNSLLNCTLINWNEEKATHYSTQKLIGSSLVNVPPVKIPVLPLKSLPKLKAYKNYLNQNLIPLRTSKNNSQILSLFNNMILLLINCYPTYCKKDNSFKIQTQNSFLSFLEDYSLVAVTKAIKDWIREQTEYPTIAELRAKVESITVKIEIKLQRLEKLISAIEGNKTANNVDRIKTLNSGERN